MGGYQQPVDGQRALRLIKLRAFGDAALHPRVDGFALHRRDNRADVDPLVERVADAQQAHAAAHLRQELGGDALLNQEARSGAADLPLIEPDGIDQALDRAILIGVVEDDEGRFAAQFEREPLARSGGRAADDAPDVGRSGEGDLVEIGMLGDQRAGRVAAGDDVDHAGRQSGFGDDLAKQQGGQAGLRRGLDDDGVAHRQRRGDLPRQHQQREVPRDHLPDDADRLIVRQFALHQLRPTGVIVEVARHQRDVDVARFADRLAVVERLQHRQQAIVLLDVAGDGVEIAGAGVPAQLAPRGEGGAGGSDGVIDVLGVVGVGVLRQRIAGGGVDAGQIAAGFRLRPVIVDEQPELALVRVEPCVSGIRRFRRRSVGHGLKNLGY